MDCLSGAQVSGDYPRARRAQGWVARSRSLLPDDFPPPIRTQLRVVSCAGNKYRDSSVPGAQYRFSCVGRLSCRSENCRNWDYFAAVYFRTTARPGGLGRTNGGMKNAKRPTEKKWPNAARGPSRENRAGKTRRMSTTPTNSTATTRRR